MIRRVALAAVTLAWSACGHTGHLQIERDGDVSATCHDDLVCNLTQEGDAAADNDIWIELAEGTAP